MPKKNIVIDQGTTFSNTFILLDDSGEELIVSGYQARAQLRKHYLSNTAIDFTCALSNGSVILSLSSSVTSNLVSGRWVYDIELIDSANVVSRAYEGIVSVTPEVTKS